MKAAVQETSMGTSRRRRSASTEAQLGAGYVTEWDPRLCETGDAVAAVHDSFMDVNPDRKDPAR
jgi:hypothetical protein